MPPELVAGRYRLLRAVGRGGMGTVWLAEDELLGREVAVKQVGRLPGESVTDSARAMREARSSAALDHHNVVSVFDVVETGQEIWLVMEYVPSRTLGQLLRDEGRLPPRRAAHIGAQVADALAVAHAVGTIHRDVKPGNILVGDEDLAKLSDFGIARRAGDPTLTQTGLMTGTPAYFSPELARGADPGPASDVWALGATLYAAVEGSPPFPEQRNPIAMLQVIATEPPARPEHGGELTDAIVRMMDPDPATRWEAADAAHALRRLVQRNARPFMEPGTALFTRPDAGEPDETGDEPVVADRPDHDQREPEPVSREPAAAAPRSRRDTEGGPVPEPDRHRTGKSLLWVLGAVALLAVAAGGYALLDLGDDAEPSAASQEAGASLSPSDNAEPESSATPEDGQQEPPDETPESSGGGSENAVDGNEAKARFVQDYFSTVTQDTSAGWSQLAPSMKQDMGRSDYESWWRSIESVDTEEVEPLPGQPAVEVSLVYHFTDGRVVRERQRLTLEQSGNNYRIADDEVLTSRTLSG